MFTLSERHVTAFRPISEAALSWSYDNSADETRQWCIADSAPDGQYSLQDGLA